MRAASPPGGLGRSGQSPGPAPSAERAAAAVRSSCPAVAARQPRILGKKTGKRQERQEREPWHGEKGRAGSTSKSHGINRGYRALLRPHRRDPDAASRARIFRGMPAPGPAGWHLALCPCPHGSVAAPGWFGIAEPAGGRQGSALLSCLASRKAGRHCGPARSVWLQQSDLLT